MQPELEEGPIPWTANSPTLLHFRAFIERDRYFAFNWRDGEPDQWHLVLGAYGDSISHHTEIGNVRGLALDRLWLADAIRRHALLTGATRLPRIVHRYLADAAEGLDIEGHDPLWLRSQQFMAEMFDDDALPGSIEEARQKVSELMTAWSEVELGGGMAQTLIEATNLELRFGDPEAAVANAVCVVLYWPLHYPEFARGLRQAQRPLVKVGRSTELENFAARLRQKARDREGPFHCVSMLQLKPEEDITADILRRSNLVGL